MKSRRRSPKDGWQRRLARKVDKEGWQGKRGVKGHEGRHRSRDRFQSPCTPKAPGLNPALRNRSSLRLRRTDVFSVLAASSNCETSPIETQFYLNSFRASRTPRCTPASTWHKNGTLFDPDGFCQPIQKRWAASISSLRFTPASMAPFFRCEFA